MVKAQPLKCTNTFQRGKSETEDYFSGPTEAPLCPDSEWAAQALCPGMLCVLLHWVFAEVHGG